MRPQCDYILRTLGTVLATKFMPSLEADHARAEMGLTALILGVISEEFERVAHRRIEENREMRNIFQEAIPVVQDEHLKNELIVATEKTEVDFHISALDHLNCELQKVLIHLHAHIEDVNGPEARTIEEAIWEELEKQVQRREFMTWEVAAAVFESAAESSPEAAEAG
ncbi:MAG: hypothetical protein R6U50_05825 [Desulfobacterales bacterium]